MEEELQERGIKLTADEWLLRRQAEVSMRSARRVFARRANGSAPQVKRYREDWDELFTQFMTRKVEPQGR